MSWLRYLRRNRRERELADEIQSYLAIAIDENLAAGMTPEEAVLAARRKFGNATRVTETVRDMNSFTWFEDLWSDLRYGVRVLRLNPAFFAVASLSLALGIGANTAIFELLNAVRLRTLPVERPAELAKIKIAPNEHCCHGNIPSRNSDVTNPIWEQIRDRQQGFSGVFAFGDERFNIAERGEARFVEGLWVSGGAFKTLGIRPVLGRLIDESDDRPGCGSSVGVISYPFWRSEFGGSREVLGKRIPLNGRPLEIVGVTAAGFYGVEVGRTVDVLVPICSEPFIHGVDTRLNSRRDWWLSVLGRVKPDWTLERATAQVAAISKPVFENTIPANVRPQAAQWYSEFKLTAEPAASGVSSLRSQYEDPLWLLLAIAGAVLLIACANLANLMLARASVREREMAVRLAIGARRGRLVRQLLTESALLTVAGTVLGAFLASSLSNYLVRFLSTNDAPLFLDLGTDWRMLAFTTAVAVVTCLLFGLTPALSAAHTAPGAAMKTSGRSVTADRSRFGLRRALVVGQVALSLVLLTGALLFGRSLRNLNTVDVGIRKDGLLIADVDLTNLKYSPERRSQAFKELLDRVRETPGIEKASTAAIVQLSGNSSDDAIEVVGTSPSHETDTWFNWVSAGYFETMGIPLLAGRDFNDRDTPESPLVVVVNQNFADKYLKGSDPIGRQFHYRVTVPGQPYPVWQIVGVVRNSKYKSLRGDREPIAYLPMGQQRTAFAGVHMLLRSRDSSGALAAAAKRTILGVNSDIIVRFQAFSTQVDDGILRDRLMATLSGFFGMLAAVLATVGLYGVISYMVARRRNEIGIRVALGASGQSIAALILREASILLGVGLAIGALVSISTARLTQSLLYGLQAQDPVTIGAAVALLGAVSLCASLLPAMRAARVDPIEALREE